MKRTNAPGGAPDPEILTVHSTDSSVIAAAVGERSYRYFYHSDCEPDCIVEIVHIAPRVPRSIRNETIRKLLVHGTSEQEYSDGYDAYSAMNRIRR